jgi:hypothetical protein
MSLIRDIDKIDFDSIKEVLKYVNEKPQNVIIVDELPEIGEINNIYLTIDSNKSLILYYYSIKNEYIKLPKDFEYNILLLKSCINNKYLIEMMDKNKKR